MAKYSLKAEDWEFVFFFNTKISFCDAQIVTTVGCEAGEFNWRSCPLCVFSEFSLGTQRNSDMDKEEEKKESH